MTLTKEQINERIRLSKMTPYERYKEIKDREFNNDIPSKWAIFRALVDYEINTGILQRVKPGKCVTIKGKTHFMNKCPKTPEVLDGEYIESPPLHFSRKKANGVCILKAIQEFYKDFDHYSVRNWSECDMYGISNKVWAIFNKYMRDWRLKSGHINKSIFGNENDWLSISFKSSMSFGFELYENIDAKEIRDFVSKFLDVFTEIGNDRAGTRTKNNLIRVLEHYKLYGNDAVVQLGVDYDGEHGQSYVKTIEMKPPDDTGTLSDKKPNDISTYILLGYLAVFFAMMIPFIRYP